MTGTGEILRLLLAAALLFPLGSFFLILLAGPRLGKHAASIATAAIGTACFFSFVSLFGVWLPKHWPGDAGHHEEVTHAQLAPANGSLVVRGQDPAADHAPEAAHEHDVAAWKPYYAGEYYLLGQFGRLRLSISYYIDALTVCMFCMVTLIATLIHVYAMGYMHDELHDITDKLVTMSDGKPLHRPGRFHRFFQYLSLFCFSMLGIVLSGSVAMVFVFWELVGICSYFLIGFYVERKSASTAANKAFIVNRVGDFGMIIGLMVLWSSLGTLSFGDIDLDGDGSTTGAGEKGIFSLVRPEEGSHALRVPNGLVVLSARDKVAAIVRDHAPMDDGVLKAAAQVHSATEEWRGEGFGYWLLVLAGIGIFCGCVGKSAQFPLHVWLPDAMEGPTPVSALVHSATMVAAGVYLVGRFYPVFAPEALLVIAVVGVITLFLAATIAITATDIKRVLAYSTVSQLGYMMLALGVGGWLAGMMHLITHAFFKSLLFMCSGSVIHAVHTNEMTEMGGLRKKMPVTAYTMLVGCLAIAGISIPFIVGFSGYYSKDAILEQAYSFMGHNVSWLGGLFFYGAAGGAAITAFYMFRMWYLTFAGKPRNQSRYDHAHESPKAMYVPLIVLSVFATGVAWRPQEAIIGAIVAGVISLIVVLRNKPAVAAGSHHGSHGGSSHSHGSQQKHGDHGGHDHGHDHHEGDHGHAESLSPRIVWLPLILSGAVLVFALLWMPKFSSLTLSNLLEQARPDGTLAGFDTSRSGLSWPNEHDSHAPAIVTLVTWLATATALGGILLATAMYAFRWLNPGDVRAQFGFAYRLLLNKWWFDELYNFLFVRPSHAVARFVSGVDRHWIDWIVDGVARVTRWFAVIWDRIADRTIVDGLVNLTAHWSYSVGLALRGVQTGRLRQYVLFIVVGAVTIFVLISMLWNPTFAS